MSNSIWKMPDQKPEENKLIFAQHDRHRDGNIDYFIWDIHEFRDVIRKDSIRWCYLDELFAQADKAEQLQKVVDLALNVMGGLKSALTHTGHTGVAEALAADINEIKQLIKGE